MEAAVEMMKADGYEFRCVTPTGELWRNLQTNHWRLLKKYNDKWEVQVPQQKFK